MTSTEHGGAPPDLESHQILIISLTGLEFESRVRRQITRLGSEGFSLCVAAKPSESEDLGFIPDNCHLIDLSQKNPSLAFGPGKRFLRGLWDKIIITFLRRFVFWLVVFVPGKFRETVSKQAFLLAFPDLRSSLLAIEAEKCFPKLVVAHDFLAGFIANRLFPNSKLIVDVHEHTPSQYEYRGFSAFAQTRASVSVESAVLRVADEVNCVSASIASDLGFRYNLAKFPNVVRSIPVGVKPPAKSEFRAGAFKFLYLGFVTHGRGLEKLVKAFAGMPSSYELDMVGDSTDSFAGELSSLVSKLGLESRIKFLPSVSPTDLLEFCSAYDVGVYLPPGRGLQKLGSLPNKFFEYLLAGLPVLVSNSLEMGAISSQYGFGFVTLSDTPGVEEIQESLWSISRETIEEKRDAANIARFHFDGDREQDFFVKQVKCLLMDKESKK